MIYRNHWSNRGRFAGLSKVACMAFAVLLSVASVAVVAQTSFEFEDPLDDARSRIERGVSAPDVTPTPLRTAGSETPDVKGPVTVMAERVGLPTAALVGMGLVGLLGLLFGLLWLFRRSRTSQTQSRKDRELYAVTNGSRARRTLESGAKVSRNRKLALDTTEGSEAKAKAQAQVTAAAAAAKVISDSEDELELTDAYQAPETMAATPQPTPDPKDPSTWQQPNLDRLKASIRDDWKSDDKTPTAADAASHLAESPASAARADAPVRTRPAVDILDDDDMPGAEMNFSDEARKTVEAVTDAPASRAPRNSKAARPSLPSRSDAVRRIKALRESVKAS